MYVRIPFLSKAEHSEPLRQCLRSAARFTELTEHQIARIMSEFLQELAMQVALGRTVRIPGFGCFGAKLYHSRKPGIPPRAYPAFSGSRGFKQDVANMAPLDGSADWQLQRYAKDHHPSGSPKNKGASVAGAMMAFRRQIEKQEEEMGLR